MTKYRVFSAIAAILVIMGIVASSARAEPAAVTYDLNLRSGPGLGYPVILTMAGGSIVEVGECYDGVWCEIEYGDYYGFANINYLDFAYYARGYTPPAVVVLPRYYDPYTRYYRNKHKRKHYRAKRHDHAPYIVKKKRHDGKNRFQKRNKPALKQFKKKLNKARRHDGKSWNKKRSKSAGKRDRKRFSNKRANVKAFKNKRKKHAGNKGNKSRNAKREKKGKQAKRGGKGNKSRKDRRDKS